MLNRLIASASLLSYTTSLPSRSEEVRRSEALLSFSMSAYAAGRFSPRRLERSVLEPGTVVEDDDEDMKRLEWAREAVKVLLHFYLFWYGIFFLVLFFFFNVHSFSILFFF